MTEKITQHQQPADDEIDLRELFSAIWQGKWLIIVVTAVFAIAAVIYALSLPNIYKSEALLAPASEQKNTGISGQLGGLAALAGVSLGGGAGVDKTALAIEILKSREFIARFIDKYDLLIPLMAVSDWNLYGNELVYDEEIYDVNRAEWIREVAKPKQAKPSLQEAHKIFIKQLSVVQDQTTGMVKVGFEHYSPYIAAEWVQLLIVEINNEMKSRDIQESQDSIIFLQQQIKDTNLSELRTALYSLIEEQTKTLMLANVRPEYAFKTVDPAVIPEEKSKPSRALICFMITLLGGLLAVIVITFRYIFVK